MYIIQNLEIENQFNYLELKIDVDNPIFIINISISTYNIIYIYNSDIFFKIVCVLTQLLAFSEMHFTNSFAITTTLF